MALLEEVCHWGQALRFQNNQAMPASYVLLPDSVSSCKLLTIALVSC